MVGWRWGQLGGSVVCLLMVHPMVIEASSSDHSMERNEPGNVK